MARLEKERYFKKGAVMWFNIVPLSVEAQDELSQYSMSPGFRVVSAASLPHALPLGFREKVDSAVLITQPTSTGGLYLVFNNYRVDIKPRVIDREPFAVIQSTTGVGSLGVFVHHGGVARPFVSTLALIVDEHRPIRHR